MQIHPIGSVESSGANSGAASTIGNAKLVLAYNKSSSEKLITIEDGATGNAKASFTLAGKGRIKIQKAAADEIFAESTDIEFVPLAYSN